MSKIEWITCIISAVLLVVAFAFYDQWDSERSKRIELEGRILALSGAIMAVKYEDRFTGKEYLELAIESAERVGEVGSLEYMTTFDSLCQVVYRTIPDSLPAVPANNQEDRPMD